MNQKQFLGSQVESGLVTIEEGNRIMEGVLLHRDLET